MKTIKYSDLKNVPKSATHYAPIGKLISFYRLTDAGYEYYSPLSYSWLPNQNSEEWLEENLLEIIT